MDKEGTNVRAVRASAKKAYFSQNMSIGVGGAGAVLIFSDMSPTIGKVLLAAGFLMYFNASGFI